MKKIFLLVFVLISINVFGQFPINATTGTNTSGVLTRGRASIDSFLQLNTTCFADTTAANRGRIEEIGGAMIRTCDNIIWLRNNAATAWIAQSSTSNISYPTYVVRVDSTHIAICTVNSCDTILVTVNPQTINVLNDSTIIVCNFEGSCDTINISPQPFLPTDVYVDSIFNHPAQLTDTLIYSKDGDTTQFYINDRECGLFDNDMGTVFWDSLLVFHVSPSVYRLCCDGVRRTSANTYVTLSAADPTNPRFDAIVLGSTGVVVVEGTAAATPALPQLTTCQILLTYIYIPAGSTTPGNGGNGCGLPATETIYDQNTGAPEWTPSAAIVSVNFSNTTNPYHFTIAADVGAFSTFGSAFSFTRSSTINIAQYSSVTLFIRLKSNFNANTYIGARFLNSSTAQGSTTAFIQGGTYNFVRTLTGSYQTITIPMSAFVNGALTTTVDRLTFFLYGSNAQGFYIDYIQIQEGVCQPPSTGGLTGIAAGNLSPLFTTTVTSANPQIPMINFSLTTASGGTVFGNTSNITASPSYTANPVLGRTGLTGTLGYRGTTSGEITIQPQSAAGTYNFNLPTTAGTATYLLTSQGGGGTAMTWTDPATLGATGANPTGTVGLTTVNGVATTFLRSDGAPALSQAIVPTWTGIHTFDNNLLMLTSRLELTKGADVIAANDLTLGSDGNLFTITGNTQINAITTANWQAGSQIAFIFTGTPTLKNNTAGGAGTAPMLLAGRVDFVAAAGDYIALQYDGTNWYETNRKLAASGPAYTASEGLHMAGTDVRLGGTLTKDTVIAMSTFLLTLTSSQSNTGAYAFNVNNSAGGGSIGANNVGLGNAIAGASTSGNGLYGSATSGNGSSANATTGYAYYGRTTIAGTNTESKVMALIKGSDGTPASGMGGYVQLQLEDDAASDREAVRLRWLWTTVSGANSTADFAVNTINAGSLTEKFRITGNGRTQLFGRFQPQQGVDVASVAGAIAVGLDGNVFELTGTNAVTLISNLNWVNGSEITFVFTSTATLTDGTANSGTDIGMELAGGANFVGSADDVITLVLSEIGGTQRWREKSRSVN